jgi:hypothetical protein
MTIMATTVSAAATTNDCQCLHPVTEKTFRIVGGVLRAGVNQTQQQLI